MPCFYCGKRVSIVRQLTDADFCSDEHRQKYHELTRAALNRLVESHEQVTAPARRKGKGQTAAPKEHAPSLADRLEGPVREPAERPAPRKHVPPVPEEAAPVPEKRPVRPHRHAPAPIVTPPPVERPVPPVAGAAHLMPPAPMADGAVQFPDSDEIWASRNELDDLALPRASFEPVVEGLPSIVAPDPAGWLAVAAHPSRMAGSLRVEPTPTRGPRPAIPQAATWSGGALQEAELVRLDLPPAAGARRAVPRMARKAPAALFEAEPVLLASAGKPHEIQEPPLAGHAHVAAPAAARVASALKGVSTPGEVAGIPVHLPASPSGAAEGGASLPGRASIEALPMPGIVAPGARRMAPTEAPALARTEPLLPGVSESLEAKGISREPAAMPFILPAPVQGPAKFATGPEDVPAVAPPTKPVQPAAPALMWAHRVGEGGFQAGLPSPAGGRARSTAQPASGRMSVRPKAMPRFGLGLAATPSLAQVAPPTALGAPPPLSRKPAPAMSAVPPVRAFDLAIAQEGFALQVAERERVATGRSLPRVCGTREIAMPSGRRIEAGAVMLPGEALNGPAVSLPSLPARSGRHEMPESAAMDTGIPAAPGKARRETCEAPLARVRPMVEAGGVPVMLPAPVAARFAVHLISAHESPEPPLRPVAQDNRVTSAGWAVYPPAQSVPAGPAAAPARQKLNAGTIGTLRAPSAKAPLRAELSPAAVAFPLPETLPPAVPARFDLRIPETMPPAASAPKWFAGSKAAPVGIVLDLAVRTPGLPVFESRTTAASGLPQPGPQLPGARNGRNVTAVPHRVATDIQFEGVRPPAPVRPLQPALVVPSGGMLPVAAVAKRNVEARFAPSQEAGFAPAPPACAQQTPPPAARHTLGTAIALPMRVSQPKPGVAPRLPAGYAAFVLQPAELPRPLHLAGVLRLTDAGHRKLATATLARTPERQTADWQSFGSTLAGFDDLCSRLPGLRMSPVSAERFQIEKAPVVSGERPRPLPPVAVEVPPPAPAINKESAGLAASLGSAPAFRLGVHAKPDDRTAARLVRLAPVFRAVRRPARLPVFGSAKGKAGMPQAVFVPLEEHEDFADFRTMRMAPGYGAIPVRMVMPMSQPVREFSLKLRSADLLRAEAAPVTGTVRASAFGFKVTAPRPHLPDGWVDTVPVEFDAAAAEAAQEQSWEPLVGAIKNATRFFKFMCLGMGGLLILSTLAIQGAWGNQTAYHDNVGAGCPQQTLQAGNR